MTYVGLESAASHLDQVEVNRMPGLLQTDEYMEALVPRLRTPAFWRSNDYIRDIIDSRRRRRDRVLSGELQVSAVVDEAAFGDGSGRLSSCRTRSSTWSIWAACPT